MSLTEGISPLTIGAKMPQVQSVVKHPPARLRNDPLYARPARLQVAWADKKNPRWKTLASKRPFAIGVPHREVNTYDYRQAKPTSEVLTIRIDVLLVAMD